MFGHSNSEILKASVATAMVRSGSRPCTRCAVETCQCIYNLKWDRRRKSYAAEREEPHAVLCRVVATLRSGSPDEISYFIKEVRNFQTEQDIMTHVVEVTREMLSEGETRIL